MSRLGLRQLPARGWLLLRRALGTLWATQGHRNAAQLAFFAVLSFPAALLLAVWALSTVLGDPEVQDHIIDGVLDILPLSRGQGQEELARLLDGVAAGAGSVGVAGAVSLLYSSSGAMAALRYAVNVAWDQADTRPFVQGKALDVALVVLVVPLALGGLGLTLINAIPSALGDQPVVGGVLAFLVTDLAPLLVVFGVLLVLFRVLPIEGGGWRYAWPGALTATVGIALVQVAAQGAGALFGQSRAVYGALGAILGVIFAVYVDTILIVLGAHVSAWSARLRTDAGIDRAIAEDAEQGQPLKRALLDAARGLLVRPKRSR